MERRPEEGLNRWLAPAKQVDDGEGRAGIFTQRGAYENASGPCGSSRFRRQAQGTARKSGRTQ